MMEQCKENETMRNYKITVAGTGWDIFFKIAVQHCINNYNKSSVKMN